MKNSKINQDLKDIKQVFIAGDWKPDSPELEPFRKIFPDGVYVKHMLVDIPSLENIERAVIDEDICRPADVFIGNTFSAWSEMLYLLRTWDPVAGNFGTYEANARTNFHYNGAVRGYPDPPNPPPHLWGFCPANFGAFQIKDCTNVPPLPAPPTPAPPTR